MLFPNIQNFLSLQMGLVIRGLIVKCLVVYVIVTHRPNVHGELLLTAGVKKKKGHPLHHPARGYETERRLERLSGMTWEDWIISFLHLKLRRLCGSDPILRVSGAFQGVRLWASHRAVCVCVCVCELVCVFVYV